MTTGVRARPAETTRPLDAPRLGFLGLGWIGKHRLDTVARSGLACVAGVADSSSEVAREAGAHAPGCQTAASLDELLEMGLDGIVIATPSALHAGQAMTALERGVAVFCQKPLGRTAEETRRVVDAARAVNRLLHVDLSYRFTSGMQRIRDLVRRGDLGVVYAVDLVFHNAYGPGQPWFFDPALSGGGCVIDLGIHLIDLALWTLDFPAVSHVTSRLYSKGVPLPRPALVVEDYAEARLDLESGASVRLACSWNLPAGQDAVIEAAFYGTTGGAAMRNVGGSFYDFTAERLRGRTREMIATAPDEWSGRAAVAWVERLASGAGYDPRIERVVEVAAAIDAIYGR